MIQAELQAEAHNKIKYLSYSHHPPHSSSQVIHQVSTQSTILANEQTQLNAIKLNAIEEEIMADQYESIFQEFQQQSTSSDTIQEQPASDIEEHIQDEEPPHEKHIQDEQPANKEVIQQIAIMNQQILQYQLSIKAHAADQSAEQSAEQTSAELISLLEKYTINEQILAQVQKEADELRIECKNAGLVKLIDIEGDDMEVQLIEKMSNTEVNISQMKQEINKLRREVKRNQEILPQNQQTQELMYQKYQKLKRLWEEKIEKHNTNQLRLEKLHQHQENLQAKTIIKQDMQDSPHDQESFYQLSTKYEPFHDLSTKYQQICKQREVEGRKKQLAEHQTQQSCSQIARTIFQLKKECFELSNRITFIEQKNTILENSNSELMAQCAKNKNIFTGTSRRLFQPSQGQPFFNSAQSTKKIPVFEGQLTSSIVREKSMTNSYQPRSMTNSHQQRLMTNSHQQRLIKHEKEQSLTDDNREQFLKDHKKERSMNSNQVNTENNEESKETHQEESRRDHFQNSQSSTENTMKKIFKLKLPNVSKIEIKNNLSMEIARREKSSKMSKKKINLMKLSITERLEKIEEMEREDREYSKRLMMESKKNEAKNAIRNESKNALRSEAEIGLKLSATYLSEVSIQSQDLNLSKRHFYATESTHLGELNPDTNTQIKANSYFHKRALYKDKKISEDYMKLLELKGRKILQLDEESDL